MTALVSAGCTSTRSSTLDIDGSLDTHELIPCSLASSSDPLRISVSTGMISSNRKRKRRPAGTPDPDAEVVVLSPETLLESDKYVCEICNQGFQREQNLQMHRRRHKVPWMLLKRATHQVRKRVYVCPEPSCLHHDPCHALGDLVGIKKHFRRKHSGYKHWKCQRCSKGYAVQSDFKAHLKTCGSRGHTCDCGRVFSRVESFIEHQDFCKSAREKSTLGYTDPCLTVSSPSQSETFCAIRSDISTAAGVVFDPAPGQATMEQRQRELQLLPSNDSEVIQPAARPSASSSVSAPPTTLQLSIGLCTESNPSDLMQITPADRQSSCDPGGTGCRRIFGRSFLPSSEAEPVLGSSKAAEQDSSESGTANQKRKDCSDTLYPAAGRRVSGDRSSHLHLGFADQIVLPDPPKGDELTPGRSRRPDGEIAPGELMAKIGATNEHHQQQLGIWSDIASLQQTMKQAQQERDEAHSDVAGAELLKQQAKEQLRLASAEKAYAEHARELAKRQMELAESEFASAKRIREQAQAELNRAQLLKEQAIRRIDATCLEVTCQACRQLFHCPSNFQIPPLLNPNAASHSGPHSHPRLAELNVSGVQGVPNTQQPQMADANQHLYQPNVIPFIRTMSGCVSSEITSTTKPQFN